jgi:aminoglycoside 3-N-acetyltransferase
MSILSRIPRAQKLWLKARLNAARVLWVRSFRSYDAARLQLALRELGIRAGDAVMLHSSFSAQHGFKGSIDDLTRAWLDAVGPGGHLLMVSLPYRTSSYQYLGKLKQFDVQKTPSMMGMVSELFRRRAGVVRSLNPAHPILAFGPRAEAFIAGHEDCVHSCGPGTPFDRLVEADGVVAFFNAEFGTLTFFHYLEHMVHKALPVRLYTETPFVSRVVDRQGEARTVTTYPFSPEIIPRRRFEVLEDTLRERGLVKTVRLGNTTLEAVRVREVVDCVREMASRGVYFYDLSGLPSPAPLAPLDQGS